MITDQDSFIESNNDSISQLGTTAKEINHTIMMRFKLPTTDIKILASVEDFFLNYNNWNDLLKFLKSDSKISLRVIDYFLTTYCYQNNIKHDNVNIYNEYKKQLKKYHKKYFDPCSRGIKVPFYYNTNKCIITTICQLNFFKWFIDTGINNICINLYSNIKLDMKNIKKNKKKTIKFFDDSNMISCSTKKLIAVFD